MTATFVKRPEGHTAYFDKATGYWRVTDPDGHTQALAHADFVRLYQPLSGEGLRDVRAAEEWLAEHPAGDGLPSNAETETTPGTPPLTEVPPPNTLDDAVAETAKVPWPGDTSEPQTE